ncbi:MAG TPA: hypothetical protein VEL07_21080 [Planctomycetota bacterium]|nr:hypothetical protein [Planctomycetota bacterium]
MGILDDVMKTLQEAIEEAQGGAPRRPAPGHQQPTQQQQDDAQAHEASRRVVQARALQKQQQSVAGARERIVANSDAERHKAEAQARAAIEAQQVRRRSQPRPLPRGIAAMLGDPASVRDAIVLAEIIGKPKALQRR